MPEERPVNHERCPECGKERRAQAGLTVTQWIFNPQLCSCRQDVRKQSAVKLCPACGKPVRSNSGSITQWIFRQGACSCEGFGKTPQRNTQEKVQTTHNSPTGTESRSKGYDVSSQPSTAKSTAPHETPEDEIELEIHLDIQRFPTDRYRPIAVLGRGASGIVYLCRDTLLKKKVAIKSLHQVTPEAVIAFQEEARATSRLKHPNIISIFDFGVSSAGYPYLVMEYFPSNTLADRFKDKNLTVQQSIQIGCVLSKALAHAHQQHVFHRDIKPSNVLMAARSDARETDLRVIDFGIAKLSETDDGVDQSTTLAGTAHYMSPDMVMHKSYDSRSEIYSLGCVLFEALENRPPFLGNEPLAIMRSHVEEPIPALVNPAPHSLKELVRRMLAKEKENRPQTMTEVNEILEQLLGSLEVKSSAPADSPDTTTADRPIQTGTIHSATWMLVLVIVTGVFVTLLWKPTETNNLRSPATSKKVSAHDSNVRSFNTVTTTAIEEFKKRKETVLDTKTIFPLNAEKLFLFNEDLIAFKGYPYLKSAFLADFDIDDAGMECLTSSPISRLLLRNSKVRTLSWAPKFDHLQYLDVAYTEIDDDALQNLPPSLLDLSVAGTAARTNAWFSKVKYLKKLDISHTKVSENGFGGIKTLRLLRHLLMRDSDTKMAELRKLKDSSSIVLVDVTGCAKLDKQEVRKFAIEQMPYCDFQPYYSSQLRKSFETASHEVDQPRALQTYDKLKAILESFQNQKHRTFLIPECMLKLARCCKLLHRWKEASLWLSRGQKGAIEYEDDELIARGKLLEAEILEASEPNQQARIIQLRREALVIDEKVLPDDGQVLHDLRNYFKKQDEKP